LIDHPLRQPHAIRIAAQRAGMSQRWTQLLIPDLSERAAALWTDRLESVGAIAVTLTPQEARFDEPGIDPESGGAVELCALFEDANPQLDTTLCHSFADLPPHRYAEVADRDWANAWREHFKPRCFADRLWVCPIDTPLDAQGLPVVRLDPGAAFGTGRHETTALCLTELCRTIGPTTRDLIDYGCGSGILAIAAAKLGVPRIRAVDVDPAALAVARANGALNGVAAHLDVTTPEALPEGEADLLVANILLQPLVQLAPRFARLVRHGGQVILSGVLREQVATCIAAYQSSFAMLTPRIDGDWALLIGTRHD
jgi:ribosomal protein L11 methyltransferase